MEKRLKYYIQLYTELNVENLSKEEKENWKKDLLIQISFFQHERLVHLLVTIFFALLTMLGLILIEIVPSIPVILLEGLFIILLIPYIRHYYILENGVQKLYELYDRI